MRRLVTLAASLAAAALLIAGPALALHNQPDKGKNFKINLMTAYEPCTVPDTTTNDGVQACLTPVRSDPGCGYIGGQGKVQIKALTVGNQAFRIKLNGLESACSGQTINFFISYRKTGHLCGAGLSCTTVDVIDHPLGSCSVSATGVCKTSGALFLPGGATVGQTEILRVHGERLGNETFNTGLIIQKP